MSKAYQRYAETAPQQIEGDKRTILNALRYYHQANIQPSARDLETLTTINHSTVRDAIIELREEHTVPVANLGRGYFLVDSPDRLRRVVEHYDGVIATKEERKQAITRAYNSQRYQ